MLVGALSAFIIQKNNTEAYRTSLLVQANEMIESGKYDAAKKLAFEAMEIKRDVKAVDLYIGSQEKKQLALLEQIPETDLVGSINIYMKLMELRPSNEGYKLGLDQYKSKAEELRKEIIEGRGRRIVEEKRVAEEERNKRVEVLLINFEVIEDKVSGTKAYMHKNIPYKRRLTGLQTGIMHDVQSDYLYIRRIIQYKGDDWLFIKSFDVYTDGMKHAEEVAEFKRDHSGGTVYEWHEKNVRNSDYDMLNFIMFSRDATIRFHGENYRRDHTILEKEKVALKETFELFEALGGKLR